MSARLASTRLRFFEAAFPWQGALAGSVLWAVFVAASCALSLVWFGGFGIKTQIAAITTLYSLGAFSAFAPAVYLARLFIKKPGYGRIVALMILIASTTMLATAAVLVLEYRIYFSQWHAPFPSEFWIWQQIYTAAGAVAGYVVTGLRYYVPIGIVGLVVMSLWANRMAH